MPRGNLFIRKTINYGASTTSSATLKDANGNTAIASAQVKLYQRPKGSTSWTFVSNATTNSSGVASKSVSPKANEQYQWRYAGDSSHGAATSGVQTISVRPVISAHSTKATVPHGVAFKIYGTVNPASAGQTVHLQRQAGTAWNTIATVTIKRARTP